MSKLDKAKERILSKPKDYTYTEARYLLSKLGFKEFNKGKTSGSRVRFYRDYYINHIQKMKWMLEQ